MHEKIEKLIGAFETKTLTRRELVASLAALSAGAGAVPAAAQVSQAAQGQTLNHVSLAVADVERSVDFYSRLLGLKS